MSQLPNLDAAPINLFSVREQAQKELMQMIDSMRGKKVLVLDAKLSGPLALVAQTSLLKEHGVENLCHLSAELPQSDCKNVLYLVRPHVNLMKLIAGHIQHDKKQKIQKQFAVFFLPRRSVLCEKVLEDEGVHDSIAFGEYPLYFLPFDDDVLSLELEMGFQECHVDGDTTSIWHLAQAIHKLQEKFGLIPNVKGKGKAAAQVADVMSRMFREQPVASPTGSPEIDTLILLDRQVDMVSPMCSQLTYEGVIDEFLHINNGAVELDPVVMDSQQQGGSKKMKLFLNSSDKLYRELRDFNFGIVGPVLRQRALTLKQDYTEAKTAENQTVSELKEYMKKLKVLPEMTRHINIAQYLNPFTTKHAFLNRLSIEQTLVEGQSYDICFEYIEEMIHRQEPLVSVLRLLVLLSWTNNGLPRKQFDYLRRELLHTYGFENMFVLSNLEKAGMLKKQETKSNWLTVKRRLKLVVTDVDDSNPTDISYVFSGYAPLSIRLIQHALKGGWRSIEDIMKMLPGPTFEKKQGSQGEVLTLDSLNDANGLIESSVEGRRPVALVVFIGGITFAEISALRFLSTQDLVKYDLLVATTKLINGSSLLQTLIDTPF